MINIKNIIVGLCSGNQPWPARRVYIVCERDLTENEEKEIKGSNIGLEKSLLVSSKLKLYENYENPEYGENYHYKKSNLSMH